VAGVTTNVAHRTPGQQPREPGQHRPVSRFHNQATDQPQQHRHLASQYEHLDRVDALAACHQGQQLQDLAEDQVPKRENHDHQHAASRRPHSTQRRTSRPRPSSERYSPRPDIRISARWSSRYEATPADSTRRRSISTIQR